MEVGQGQGMGPDRQKEGTASLNFVLRAEGALEGLSAGTWPG